MDEAPAGRGTANKRAVIGVALFVGVFGIAWLAGVFDALSFEALVSRREELSQAVQLHPVWTGSAFLGVYTLVAATSLPGAAALTLLAGTFFGFWTGLALSSAASTVGAILASASARWLFTDAVTGRFPGIIQQMNQGLEHDGVAWVLLARLVPVFPFFVVNLVLGVSRVPLRTLFWTSQLGMLPGTAAYVWAGTELGAVNGPADVLSPGLIAALSVLGLLPLVLRRLWKWWRPADHA